MQVKIQDLMDDGRCYDMLRELRWPEGRYCPNCESRSVIRRGFDDNSPKQRYQCKECQQRFDDLTGTIFAGHHQPLKTWMLTLYLMGLNVSNAQIAKELELNEGDVQKMATTLRAGILEKKNL